MRNDLGEAASRQRGPSAHPDGSRQGSDWLGRLRRRATGLEAALAGKLQAARNAANLRWTRLAVQPLERREMLSADGLDLMDSLAEPAETAAFAAESSSPRSATPFRPAARATFVPPKPASIVAPVLVAPLTESFTPLDPEALAAAEWIAQGPSPATGGQVENLSPNGEVSGAVHTVIAHPTNPDILYLGGTNGGVWRTNNATATSPTWTPLTDDLPSMAIGALDFDPTDPTSQTLIAGTGRYSSFGRRGGDRVGVLHSTDGGDTWQVLDGGGAMVGRNISGVAARGDTIVVSVNTSDLFGTQNTGIFRSTDGGASFAQVSLGNGSATGLPNGVSYDLASDPTDPAVLYTSVVFSDGQDGVYKSTDTGATWAKVSDGVIEALLGDGTSNIEISVGTSNNVYVAVLNFGNPEGIFRSGDGGQTWTQMETPTTNEGGIDVGLNPRGGKGPGEGAAPAEIAGGQGSIHFAILADPSDPNRVYVGGDRQPRADGDTGGFPNSIGARDFSGRLFRGDASQPIGSQWQHLTHSNTLGAAGGGTASSSSPHADSREMTLDANGDIIEVDDGGIYRRTSPEDNTGDWFSIIGNLQVTEAHDVAYDPVANILISGNQDTGTTEQTFEGSTTWRSVSTADGGDVVVAPLDANRSVRYSSFQNLGGFRRRIVDANNNVLSTEFPDLEVTSGEKFEPQFDTSVSANRLDPLRLLIGGRNGVYESFDQGDTLTQVLPGVSIPSSAANPIVAGGFADDLPNPGVLYAGDTGGRVHVRTTEGGSFSVTDPDPFGSDTILDVRLNPDDWANAFAADQDQVFTTLTAGSSWIDVTGNLAELAGREIRSLEYVGGAVDALLAGTSLGVFVTFASTLGVWTELGATTLPNVPAWDLDYDPTDDVLAVGTLGRGVWTLPDVTAALVSTVPPPPPPTPLPLTLIDGEGFVWDIQQDGNILNGLIDAYDGGHALDDFGQFANAELENDGREVVIGPDTESVSDISLTRKIYVPNDEGFARFLEIVTNTGETTAEYTVSITTDLGSDGGAGELLGTTNGDLVFTTDDEWIVTDDNNPDVDPTVVHVVSGDAGVDPTTVQYQPNLITYTYDLTLAPGETQIVMHFGAQSGDDPTAFAKAADLTALGRGALSGMSVSEQLQVVNFDIVPPLPTSLFAFEVETSEIVQIDPVEGTIARRIASPVAAGSGSAFGLAFDGETLYAAGAEGEDIYLINPTDGSINGTLPNPHDGGAIGGLSVVGNELFVEAAESTLGQDLVAVFDLTTGNINRTITVQIDSLGGLGTDGFRLFAVEGDRLYQIDPTTGNAVELFMLSASTAVTGIGVVDGELFVVDETNTIDVYNLDNQTFARTLEGFTNLGAIGADADDSTVPPLIASVRVGSTEWSSNFTNFLDPDEGRGFEVLTPPGSPLPPEILPWLDLDQVSITFTADAEGFSTGPLAVDQIGVFGVNVPDYGSAIDSIDYDSDTRTATLTFAEPIGVRSPSNPTGADRLRISIAGLGLADVFGIPVLTPEVVFNVVPGDVNRDGAVTGADVGLIRLAQPSRISDGAAEPGYEISLDVTGNGVISGSDVSLTRLLQFTELPDGLPEPPATALASETVDAPEPVGTFVAGTDRPSPRGVPSLREAFTPPGDTPTDDALALLLVEDPLDIGDSNEPDAERLSDRGDEPDSLDEALAELIEVLA